jgi:hypothetical protein
VPGAPADRLDDVNATHFHVGGVAGLRAGFRHIHVAVEVDAGYHRARGTFGSFPSLAIEAFAITPAGALTITF